MPLGLFRINQAIQNFSIPIKDKISTMPNYINVGISERYRNFPFKYLKINYSSRSDEYVIVNVMSANDSLEKINLEYLQ